MGSYPYPKKHPNPQHIKGYACRTAADAIQPKQTNTILSRSNMPPSYHRGHPLFLGDLPYLP